MNKRGVCEKLLFFLERNRQRKKKFDIKIIFMTAEANGSTFRLIHANSRGLDFVAVTHTQTCMYMCCAKKRDLMKSMETLIINAMNGLNFRPCGEAALFFGGVENCNNHAEMHFRFDGVEQFALSKKKHFEKRRKTRLKNFNGEEFCRLVRTFFDSSCFSAVREFYRLRSRSCEVIY